MYYKKHRAAPEERSGEASEARAYGVRLLSRREYSSAEVYEKLCVKYTEEASAEAVADLIGSGWLDDGRYAECRANSLLNSRKSRRAAGQVLRRSGLQKEEIDAALSRVYDSGGEEEDAELTAAYRLIESRYRSRLDSGRKDLVEAALYRRGFPGRVIRAALKKAEEEKDTENRL